MSLSIPNPALATIRRAPIAIPKVPAATPSLSGDLRVSAHCCLRRSRGSSSQISWPMKALATKAANSGQRVSSTSSLRMFCAARNAISGRNRRKAIPPENPAARSARMKSGREASWIASWLAPSAISDLLNFRAAEQALRQEDHHHHQDREGGDVLVVARKVGRPEGL